MTYDSPIFGVLFPFPPGEDFRLRGTGQIGGCRNRVHGGGGAGRPPRAPSTSRAAACSRGSSPCRAATSIPLSAPAFFPTSTTPGGSWPPSARPRRSIRSFSNLFRGDTVGPVSRVVQKTQLPDPLRDSGVEYPLLHLEVRKGGMDRPEPLLQRGDVLGEPDARRYRVPPIW